MHRPRFQAGRAARAARAAQAGLALLALWSFAAAAPRTQGPERGEELAAEPEGAQREMRELFEQVERRLREIDRLLSEASAGEVRALEQLGASGIDELLRRTRREGGQAVREIDRILELARQLGESRPASSPQGSQPSPGQGSGDAPTRGRGGSSTDRERTPEAPGEERGGQGEEQRERGEQRQPGGDTPEDPRAADDPDPRTQPGAPPPASGGAPGGASPSDVERWGELPVHLRDLFRTEGGGSLPPRYRDFIDAYHRRLARRP